MKLQGNMNVRENMLYIGDYSMEYLRDNFGTPLYIVDETDFTDRCRLFTSSFVSDKIETEVLYASKALINVYMARILRDMNMSVDVVSGGELCTCLKADFPAERIYFHGNNKTIEEIEYALENNVGCFVIDNRMEFENLRDLLEGTGRRQRVLLRVNPGIEAHTHDYIKTTKNDSKFGESIFDERTYTLIKELAECKCIDFRGFHAHIGSQVFDEESFMKEAEAMLDFAREIEDKLGVVSTEINLGGGFGIYYTEEDKPFELGGFLQRYIAHIVETIEEKGLSIERVMIEPGRSLISNSGSTLYTVGSTKETYGGRNYIFVDGGMTDNIRPSLYQAQYEAIIANRAKDEPEVTYTIAGKCCESGDVLIRDTKLPQAYKGDLVLVSSTGAYNYSMSSNYNRIGKPAMVFVSDEVRLGVRRQSFEDMVRDDVL